MSAAPSDRRSELNPRFSYVLNPESSILIVYGPGGSAGSANSPRASDTVSRVRRGALVRDDDVHAWQNRAGAVLHDAVQGGFEHLRHGSLSRT